jgi:hypothetical protein
MKHFALGLIAAIALLAVPAAVSADSQSSGIWITNMTGHCLWATVYTAGSQVREGGFPNWVPANDKRLYPITWKGMGQQFRVRVEVLSTTECVAQNAAHPLVADVDTNVSGGLAYQVRLIRSRGEFFLERY